MSHSWPEKKPMTPAQTTRAEWEKWMKHDAVLVTVEFGDRVERRLILKTQLLVARYPDAIISAVLHDPIMGVIDGTQNG